MKKILIGLALLAGFMTMTSSASAGCSNYNGNSSSSYNFLEIAGGKISVYDDKVTLNVDVKFAHRSYQGCQNNFKAVKKNSPIKITCQLDRNNDMWFQGKLADTMDSFNYESMVIGKITNNSVIDDMRNYLDDGGSSRISCSVLGNDTMLKLKVVDKR